MLLPFGWGLPTRTLNPCCAPGTWQKWPPRADVRRFLPASGWGPHPCLWTLPQRMRPVIAQIFSDEHVSHLLLDADSQAWHQTLTKSRAWAPESASDHSHPGILFPLSSQSFPDANIEKPEGGGLRALGPQHPWGPLSAAACGWQQLPCPGLEPMPRPAWPAPQPGHCLLHRTTFSAADGQ